ncbi:MAG: UDP-N-acetylmuramate:L-alanyl-gamma-D-glutamyl-meso-diaminopimelate ligase [Pseudomonadota bacterium]|jgi:UDP-N-acetylmuramate: L-alanyl-gamma-D-glutamyl-meso-diaminopimelate ligase
MHLHILGVCGTFMAGIAVIAKQLGHTVTGSDANAYPPMSTQLAEQGITCLQGYRAEHIAPDTDCVIVGNALSRSNPAIEHILNRRIPYISAPQWLAENVLHTRWVLAISGTHGKTTTTSMTAWILEYAGLNPGFLIGGVPENFGVSARVNDSAFFVIEADEYDTAFFDKRSKFVHYRPQTLLINNLEFDHADIFPDLAAIQKQFQHLVRTVPSQGLIVHSEQASIQQVLSAGCWTPTETIATANAWNAELLKADGSAFVVRFGDKVQGEVHWNLVGEHNVNNALGAIACARHAGVPVAQSCAALAAFKNVKRRLELRGVVNNISVYDDFAHHPTAIQTTLAGLRQRVGKSKIIAVLEPRSNSMRMGIYQDTLAASLTAADNVLFYESANLKWSLAAVAEQLVSGKIFNNTEALIAEIVRIAEPDSYILIMSNGDFENLHSRVLNALEAL